MVAGELDNIRLAEAMPLIVKIRDAMGARSRSSLSAHPEEKFLEEKPDQKNKEG